MTFWLLFQICINRLFRQIEASIIICPHVRHEQRFITPRGRWFHLKIRISGHPFIYISHLRHHNPLLITNHSSIVTVGYNGEIQFEFNLNNSSILSSFWYLWSCGFEGIIWSFKSQKITKISREIKKMYVKAVELIQGSARGKSAVEKSSFFGHPSCSNGRP